MYTMSHKTSSIIWAFLNIYLIINIAVVALVLFAGVATSYVTEHRVSAWSRIIPYTVGTVSYLVMVYMAFESLYNAGYNDGRNPYSP